MTSDSPIIDDFDDSDPARGTRNSNWGFSSVKRSIAKSMHKNGLLGSGSSGEYTKGDIRSKRRSWKDLESIRKSLKDMADVMSDEYKDSKKDKKTEVNSYSKSRREWFAKIRYQSQLLNRLKGIEKNLKDKKSGGIFGMLGSIGALGAIGKMIKDMATGKIASSMFKAGGGAIAKQVLQGVLTALLGKSALGLAVKGIGKTLSLLTNVIKKTPSSLGTKAKSFGGKALSMLGTGLKAGKSKALALILPSLGLGGLAELLQSGGASRGAGNVLTGLMRTVLPKILGRIGMAVFGVPGAVAMTAKLVWDHVLPEKWKSYITYRIAKFYLQAIDRVSKLFEWIGDKITQIKDAVQARIASIFARVYQAIDFVGELITGEGDARTKVKKLFTGLWNTIETTIKTYIGGFLTVFKEAYNSFVKPFYDEKGNFNILRGIKHYAKAGYNFGAEAINKAGQVVDNTVDAVKQSLDSMLKSNWNPANWQKNAEVYVQQYEANQAKKGPDESSQLISKSQDKASKIFDKLEKTLQSTNSAIRMSASSAMGAVSPFTGAFSDGYSGGETYSPAGEGAANGTVLQSIAGHESGSKGYNAHNNGTAGVSRGNYNLTGMTLGQIKQLQSKSNPGGRKLFAVGKYQMIPETLRAAQKDLNISDNSVFTPQLQDYMMTNYLMKKKQGPAIRDFITGKSNNIVSAQLSLAREFASIGAPYTGRDPATGKMMRKDVSYYAGKGGNKASMSSGQAGQLLQQARANYQAAIQGGASPNEAWNKAFGSTALGGGAMMAGGGGGDSMSGEYGGDSVAQPQSTDIMTAMIQTMSNPESARRMYEGAKASIDTSVSVPKPPGNNDIQDVGSILKSMEGGSGVNSIGSQVAQGIRRPTDKGAKPNPAKSATSNVKPSDTSGIGASDLFARPNQANVTHENAFPF